MNRATRNSSINSESKSNSRRSFFGFGSTTQDKEEKPKMEDASTLNSAGNKKKMKGVNVTRTY